MALAPPCVPALAAVLFIGATWPAAAQTGPGNPSAALGAQTPTAASFAGYAAAGVEGHTGAAQLSVPLPPLPTARGPLPVSLDYAGTSVRPDEVAGWVGEGWSLRAGGVITRVVRGLPDDSPYGYPETGAQLTASIIAALHGTEYGAYWAPDAPERLYVDGVLNGQVDTHPDEFHFSFPGGGGRFLWVPSDGGAGRVWTSPHSAVRVEPAARTFLSPGPFGGGSFEGVPAWTVTDTDGTRYGYAEVELTQQPPSFTAQSADRGLYVSSWYLTEVVSPEGDTLATFTYSTPPAPFDVVERDHLAWASYRKRLTGASGCHGGGSSGSEGWSAHAPRHLSAVETATHTLVLTTGERDDGRRSSTPNVAPTSAYAPGGRQRRRLERLEWRVKGAAPVVERAVALVYNGGASTYARLRLDRVEEEAGGVARPPYSFTYYDWPTVEGGLFTGVRQTKSVDYWGYYNGRNNTSYSVIPYVALTAAELGASTGFTYTNGSNRSPSTTLSDLRAGLLESVTYPTGGETLVEYELGDYGYEVDLGGGTVAPAAAGATVGGGARVRAVTAHDRPRTAGGAVTARREFGYVVPGDPARSSGVLTRPPVFWHVVNVDATSCSCTGYSAVHLQSSPLMGLASSPPVAYAFVTESVSGAGATLREYAVPLPTGVGSPANPARLDGYARGAALLHPTDRSYSRGHLLREAAYSEGAALTGPPLRERATKAFQYAAPPTGSPADLYGMNFLSGGPERAVCADSPDLGLSNVSTFGYNGNVADYRVQTGVLLPATTVETVHE